MTPDSLSPFLADPDPRITAIAGQFKIEGEFLHGEEIPSGHINTTFRADFRQANGSTRRYIIQAINRHVFHDSLAVMHNVGLVTRHISERSPYCRALHLIPTRDGVSWFQDTDETVWRCFNFIDDCVTYDVVETPRQAWQAAHAFGDFQNLLSDLDAAQLIETIPDFHHTPKRLARLMDAAAANPLDRLKSVRDEFDFILRREALTTVLIDLAESGKIPRRVTHNDTKINNVMFDATSGEAVCVIDLDTVMPGLSLYDFGDLLRTTVSPAAEDETDLSKVEMRMPVFEALVDGYLSTASDFLNETEIAHLVHSGKLITLEVGIRFLTDYLEGDVYFKTHRPGQNLDRCRTQLKLVELIESHESEMMKLISESWRG